MRKRLAPSANAWIACGALVVAFTITLLLYGTADPLSDSPASETGAYRRGYEFEYEWSPPIAAGIVGAFAVYLLWPIMTAPRKGVSVSRLCPTCGHENDQSVEICAECGTALHPPDQLG